MSWPELFLEGAPNSRDLGGIKTMDGRVVRKNRIIRSGPLNSVTARDIAKLKSLPLKIVVDFRTWWEKDRKPDVLIEGVSYVDCPLIEDKAEGITRDMPQSLDEMAKLYVESAKRINAVADGSRLMQKMYAGLAVNDYSIAHYRQFFDILLDNENGAVLYHCTMGKDRVGVGTALILTALGVSRQAIANDYNLTKERLGQDTLALIERCRKYTGDEALLQTIYDMDSADELYLSAALSRMEEQSGSVEAYLTEKLGLSSSKISKLRQMYLD